MPDVKFSYRHVDGLSYEMVNETDVSVFGCIQDISWNVFKGGNTSGEPIADLSKKAWQPLITFPDDGTYPVIVNVGGSAGTAAAKVTIDARNHRGEGRGCSSTGLGGAGLGALAGLLVLARRRFE